MKEGEDEADQEGHGCGGSSPELHRYAVEMVDLEENIIDLSQKSQIWNRSELIYLIMVIY